MKNQYSILIVEDDPLAANALKAMLRGYNVNVANDINDACNSFLEVQPDICLVDIGLPSGSGYDFADIAFSARCIMMSSSMIGVKDGYEFILKPIDKKELLQCIGQ